MALAQNRLIAAAAGRLRSKVGVRFTRFVIVAAAALTATEVALTVCNGVFHMTAVPAALVSWFVGAVVSYVLSRWAWERKGKPDVLRETVPFWVISAMVIVILTLAVKFAYHSASWMGLTGIKHVLWVDFIWLVANFCTFLLRFVIFHYVLFAEPTTAARAAATGPDAVPPGTRKAPSPAEAPHAASAAAGPDSSRAGSARAAGNASDGQASGASAAKASGAKPGAGKHAAPKRDSAKSAAPGASPQASPAE
jgi:putative flippase GtrA